MRRELLLLILAGLGIVAASVFASGRRAPVIAFGCLAAGSVVAFGSSLLVDCRSCRTDALFVGALAAAPFFLIGIVACAATPSGAGYRNVLGAAAVLLLFQTGWSAMLVWVATLRGDCPCLAWPIGTIETTLRAVGTDRLAGPLFLIQAMAGLYVLQGARRRA